MGISDLLSTSVEIVFFTVGIALAMELEKDICQHQHQHQLCCVTHDVTSMTNPTDPCSSEVEGVKDFKKNPASEVEGVKDLKKNPDPEC